MPDVAGLDAGVDGDGFSDDFAGADEDSDDDGVELDDEPPDPVAARLSVR